jgi:N-acetylmuramoyl-L-alanine amidase
VRASEIRQHGWRDLQPSRYGLGEVRATPTNKFLALSLAMLLLLTAAISADERQLSVYAPVATYTLPVQERSGHEYVGLLELLEPLGRVSSEASAGRWRIRFNAIDAEFSPGKVRARVQGREADLTAPFLVENGRGFVSVASLGTLLPRFLGSSVNFHESARRLFIGDVAIRPSFRLETDPQPRLVLNFAVSVNPTISTEPGRLRMVFKHDAVVAPENPTINFDSKAITQASFAEANGVAELDIAATIPLIASFSNGAKTITLSAPPGMVSASPGGTSAQGAGSTGGTAPPAVSNPAAQTATAPPAPPQQNVVRLLAVVDPAHGGEERGAALTDKLAEKDVTLGFGRLLRHEFEIRGFAVLMLRDGDYALTQDQRAGTANAAHGIVYVCLHAISQGSGAGVYTSLMPFAGPDNGTFRSWNSAQASALSLSRTAAAAIASELEKKQFNVHEAVASLQPLNNVTMPAVAVELAPGPNGISDLTSATYQQKAAAAVADAINGMRDRLVVQP